MPIATTQSDFRNHIKDYLDKVNDEKRVSRMLCKKGNFARMNWQF